MAKGINKVILLGNLAADPEFRMMSNGSSGLATCSIATNETYKDQQGQTQERVEWHRLVFWGKLADVARDYLRKGLLIYVEGKLRTRSYDDKQNIKHYVTEIQVTDMQILTPKGQNPAVNGMNNGGYQNNNGGYQNNGYQPNQYQNNGYQSNNNGGYSNNGYQGNNGGYQNNGYQQNNNGYQNNGNNGYQNSGYQPQQANNYGSRGNSYQNSNVNDMRGQVQGANEAQTAFTPVNGGAYQGGYGKADADKPAAPVSTESKPAETVAKEPDMTSKPFAADEDALPF